jgi:hypothetical protein
MSYPFNQRDIEQIQARGITLEQAESQIETFRNGFSYCHLQRPCTKGDGITVLKKSDLGRLGKLYSKAALSGKAMKFVPASGAASRMFQVLLTAMDQPDTTSGLTDAEQRDLKQFINQLQSYAFYDDLNTIIRKAGLDIEVLISKGQYGEILEYLLTDKGLNYGHLCKGLIKFHRYPDHCRTSLEEHLVEAAAYVQDKKSVARVHYTVPAEQRETISAYLDEAKGRFESPSVKFEMGLSIQKPSTDTIAVNLDNEPFRDREGGLVFRPGGHGALLENLQELDGEIVFIKNIDNVVPDRLKGETYTYKKALGGLLVEVQDQTFGYLRELNKKNVTDKLLKEAFAFSREKLSVVPSEQIHQGTKQGKVSFLLDKLNRPLRVCGMVKSTGEPGGGPFWVGQDNKTATPQIVESSQVNMESSEQRDIWNSSTHFNPVDIVCGLQDFRGKRFDLSRFYDPSTCFISTKSMDGKPLKALELPGLWNGSMAFWNTIFVEVPLITFNPVKTFLDLLEEAHGSS